MTALLPAAVALSDAGTTPVSADTVGLLLVGASVVVTMDRIGRERVFEDAEIPQVRPLWLRLCSLCSVTSNDPGFVTF